MEELWKDIKAYEGLYKVSNLGNFRKTNTCNASKLGYSIGKNGYKTVSLANDCARKLGLSQSNINRCLKNRRKTLGGYTFEYAK